MGSDYLLGKSELKLQVNLEHTGPPREICQQSVRSAVIWSVNPAIETSKLQIQISLPPLSPNITALAELNLPDDFLELRSLAK